MTWQMSSRQEVLPNILWKVENLWGNEKKCSDVVTFLGMSWKLKLLYLPETGGVRIKLILKRLTPITVSQDTTFGVDTCLLKQYGSGEYFRQTLTASVSFKEWCIWTQYKSDVEKQEHAYHRNSIAFLVVITPGDKWCSLLQGSYKKKPEVPVAPCLQSLTGNLEEIFDSDVHCDVVLSSGGRTFRAHKAILSARSEVFGAMFRCDMRESREGAVSIVDVEPDVLELFLRYLYTGEVRGLTAKMARKLYAVADKYAVEALKTRCAFAVMDSYLSGSETQIPSKGPNTVTYITESDKMELRKKELTRDVLASKEWRTLAEEHPQLAAAMCAPLMAVVHEEEPPPAPAVQEKQETPETGE